MKNLHIEIKWAIIFTGMTLLWMWAEKMSGLHSTHIDQHMLFTNLYAIPAILVYGFALWDKKKNHFNGIMNFREGLVTGLWITLFVTILAPLNQYLIITYLTPEFFVNARKFAIESGKMNPDQANSFFSLKNYVLKSIVGTPVMGAITSAIVAITFKSKHT